MDQRQSIAEAAVTASEAMFPERGMAARWEPVRARCYAAAGAYLALGERLDQAERAEADVSQQDVNLQLRQLADAAHAVDEFYRGNQAHLEHAAAVYGAVPQLVSRVRDEAQRAARAAADSPYVSYPSVRRALADNEAGLVALETAAATGAPGPLREAATRLEGLAKIVSRALDDAPGKQQSATTALTSAATRLAAARNRLDRIAPAMSTLLREFAAASSNDLAGNEAAARAAVAAAETDLDRARTALAHSDPEQALDLTTSARAHLTTAEECAEAVTRRLTLLRAVREQPQERAKTVRFKLRDAQMLAVNNGLVAQWGSVLDAQAERIDRVTAGLTGRHPDYWAYVSELDAISAFIAGVVERMRNTQR